MRINLGIRRRLAPLMENNRRRIELMNRCSSPCPARRSSTTATRSGWATTSTSAIATACARRCSGAATATPASRAPIPQQLYLPAIIDPQYHYEQVNVEAQERYPFSLLNWMKRLIALRKQHRVFGRGSLEFVGCPNRKVLAYLRRDDRETILVVVNLSRSGAAGRARSGRVRRADAGRDVRPHRVPAHRRAAVLPDARPVRVVLVHAAAGADADDAARAAAADPDAAILEALPALLVGVDWQGVLDAATRGVIERQALRPFLLRQRWFGSKSREIRQARFSDWTTLRKGPTPAFLTVVSVEYRGRLDRELLRAADHCFPAKPPSARCADARRRARAHHRRAQRRHRRRPAGR